MFTSSSISMYQVYMYSGEDVAVLMGEVAMYSHSPVCRLHTAAVLLFLKALNTF